MYKFFENIINKIRNLNNITKGILIAMIIIIFYIILFTINSISEVSNIFGNNITTNTNSILNVINGQNNIVNNETSINATNKTIEQKTSNATNIATSYNTTINTIEKTLAPSPVTYTVKRVVDGDTLKIDYNGKEESVRLIGVDTPESVHPDESKNTEFGKKASEFSKNYLEGKQISLEFDVQERDKYGRLLAYVYLNGIMYNKTLLEEGYAKIATYPPNVKYVDDFTKIQEEARNNKKGLWAYQTTTEETPANEENTSATENTDNNSSSSNIQYNGRTVYRSKTGTKYHYSSTCSNMKNPTEITLDEAKKQGLEPCKKCVE